MSLELSFHGAAGCVTGFCARLHTARASVLIDCGMFQGPKALKVLNYDPFPFAADEIDAALLTHAHIDHSGLLPKLMRAGFSGAAWRGRASTGAASSSRARTSASSCRRREPRRSPAPPRSYRPPRRAPTGTTPARLMLDLNPRLDALPSDAARETLLESLSRAMAPSPGVDAGQGAARRTAPV